MDISPEDQAILEAAYKRDPKPDKTARQELVKHVALGEKEVQVHPFGLVQRNEKLIVADLVSK